MFKPILATDADLNKLNFPLLASAKLDGVRAIVRDGVVYSRSNKPIPNKYVQRLLHGYEYYDGELIVGSPTSKSVYRDTVSYVMSHDKEDFDLHFMVFDHVMRPAEKYSARLEYIKLSNVITPVQVHEQHIICSLQELLKLEEKMLDLGYEGLILRSADAPYKMGRSTVKEGYLLKLKRMETSEAIIIGFEERQENTNEKTINELGRSKRSSHKAGKVGRGDLGALILRREDGVEFSCGTGFDDQTRREIWDNRDKYLGKLVSYDHFPIGIKDKPRHPSYKGLRSPLDL